MKRKRKGFLDEYYRIIGFIVLVYVFIMLFSTPSQMFAKRINTLDTELSQASTDATFIRATMDFGNNEHMRAFSNNIGGWEGSDYNTAGVAESLGADVMLMRSYINPETFQPVIFLIIQSNNRSSFHPPIVCYPALGYTIEEEGKAKIPVRNISWVEEPSFGTTEKVSNVVIPAKKLIVVKQSKEGEKVTQRKVVLYFYVKENPVTSDTFTMIRVSALAPTEGSYEGFLNLTAEFMGNTIPYMFELRKSKPFVIFSLFASLAGKVVVGLLLLVPLLIMFYPEIKRLRKV